MTAEHPLPVSVRREGAEHLAIDWSDGHHSIYTWRHLRKHCPCAGCREEHQKPPDPFHILKPGEMEPPTPVAMPRMGRYAYKITWKDGHDTGIFTIEHLRNLCQCPECTATKQS